MEENNMVPLVTNFIDLGFLCRIDYSDDKYRYRSSAPSFTRRMYSIKKDDMYILNCVFDYHAQVFIENYSITGEYTFGVYIHCVGKTLDCVLGKSITCEKDELKELVNNNKIGENNSESDFIEHEMKIFTSNINDNINDNNLHQARFYFKKSCYGLIPAHVEISLPCALCDKWYERFARNDYQQSYGPKLL